ncbi:MAG: Lrp/AsnC family transcriptional regulator [Thermoplasmatales archaeon]|nr:Lrp/AsnC family transcriptional regulator [Thermoplasmatales archaeon]
MVKIDVKDRKILYQLANDSRQSFRSIGRKVGLSKDIVASRVKRLQEKGVILRFLTIYDYSKLGLTRLRFYFKYQYVTPEIKNEIIAHLVNCDYSTAVVSTEGSYDLMALMLVKNVNEFYSFWQNTLDQFGEYFEERVFSVYIGETVYNCSFLIDEKKERAPIGRTGKGDRIDIDELDFQILKLLVKNARMPIVEIAQKLHSTVSTINNRIKRLIESGVISGFETLIDFGKLGYQWFKVDLFLKEYKKTRQIIKYVTANPHLYVVDYTLGYSDLELEYLLKNTNHLREVIDDITVKFPAVIKNYKYFQIVETHKFLILDMKQIQI